MSVKIMTDSTSYIDKKIIFRFRYRYNRGNTLKL